VVRGRSENRGSGQVFAEAAVPLHDSGLHQRMPRRGRPV
jgi:hypothetical protein